MRSLVRIVGVMMLVSLVGLLVAGCGEEEKTEVKTEVKPEVKREVETEIAQKTCPVMGGAINKAIYADHNGRRVYFCCAGCVDTFKKDPAKYLKKVDAEIKKAKDAAGAAAEPAR